MSARAEPAAPPAELQKEYDAFIVKFRAALKNNDRAAVTAMTQFPFLWGNTRRDAAYFRKSIYSKLFTAKNRACIARDKPGYDKDPMGNEYFVFTCGEQLFLFGKTPAGFLLSEIGVND